MPAGFTSSFAQRLNDICDVTVKEAENGDTVVQGRVLIAPGDYHTLLRRSGAQYVVEVKQGPLVDRHRPSVSVLFNSAAQSVAHNCVAAMLTGMGDDGAKAMLNLRNAGAMTLAQDEASCVVFGMPRAAIECGAVHEIVPLKDMTTRILAKCSSLTEKASA